MFAGTSVRRGGRGRSRSRLARPGNARRRNLPDRCIHARGWEGSGEVIVVRRLGCARERTRREDDAVERWRDQESSKGELGSSRALMTGSLVGAITGVERHPHREDVEGSFSVSPGTLGRARARWWCARDGRDGRISLGWPRRVGRRSVIELASRSHIRAQDESSRGFVSSRSRRGRTRGRAAALGDRAGHC